MDTKMEAPKRLSVQDAAHPEPPAKETEATPSATSARLGGREIIVVLIVGLLILGMLGLIFVRPVRDRGIRLWLLNHAPDQLIIVNPDTGEEEKKLLIADGLVQVIFNHRKDTAYIANVVDVANRITVLDTRNYLKLENIIVAGVPQGMSIFPDDKHLAVITGSKTDFMAGGFDVLDLTEPSQVDPQRKRVVYRERGLRLTSSIHVDEQGRYIYVLDAKRSSVFIFDCEEKKLVRSLDIGSAPISLLYPEQGDYFFVSSIADKSITIFRKAQDPIEIEKAGVVKYVRFRHMAVSPDASILYAPSYEKRIVVVINVRERKVANAFATPEGCQLIAVSPLGDELYPVGYDTGKVFVMNARTGHIRRTVQTQGDFRDIKVLLESEKPSAE